MIQEDYRLFMAGLDTIKPEPAPRYHAESDGDSNSRTHYVKHSRTFDRIECATRKEAVETAERLNRE